MDNNFKTGNMARGCPMIDIENARVVVKGKGNCNKLNTIDWMNDMPALSKDLDYYEVRFKNTRKAIYYNINKLKLEVGDIVAVEATPGHDIGVVSTGGPLVKQQIRKLGLTVNNGDMKKIYRKAKPADIDKWLEAVSLEHRTMLKSRKISDKLKLAMKIGDVEYQGDKTKAIFYYIADERVDFRELIKVLADEFKIRIEMRQIGARQEAGLIGGIGACGRELCCATFLTHFVSVNTSAARFQEVTINPQKLAGQCSKLKCCLNFEVHTYIDAQKDFPRSTIELETKDGTAYHHKTDILKRVMWYSYDKSSASNLIPVPVDRVKEVIDMNKAGQRPDVLSVEQKTVSENTSFSILDDSLDRFDKKANNKQIRKKQPRKNRNKYKKNRNTETNREHGA
jgi:cell fate regulator YaaT (PSP1 superfamily)